ncbi:alpha/beta hydrolase, partial [Acinetobacter johnsonii]
MIHTVIVPGVGGSEHDHWQSWLQRQLKSCSRVQQQDWNKPILHEWIE